MRTSHTYVRHSLIRLGSGDFPVRRLTEGGTAEFEGTNCSGNSTWPRAQLVRI